MAGYIIYRLKEWAEIEEVRLWLEAATKDFSVAKRCLFHLLSLSQSTGRVVRTYILPAKSIEDFIPLETLLDRLDGPDLTTLEIYAKERIKLALQRKAKGEAYDRIPILGFDEEGEEITELNELKL